MNTVITPVVDGETDELLGYDFNEELGDQVVKSLIFNNTFLPGIDHVVFNTKVDGDKSTLATVVYFRDGTKATVKNSETDKIGLVEEEVSSIDGNTVKVVTASRESRETGLLYALVKRAVCGYDGDGKVGGAGFASFLKKTLKGAYRQDVEAALAKADKTARKNAQKGASDVGKPRKTSFRETVQNLSKAVDCLTNLLKTSKTAEG